MIKDKNEQQRLLALFKALPSAVCEQIEQEYMPHYLIYHRKGNKFDCYCTHCRQHYEFIRNGTREWMNGVGHNIDHYCLKCGYPIACLAVGYGRGNIKNARNFAIFSRCENGIMIQCFRVYEKFEDKGSQNLIFDYDEKQRYYISPENVQHWTSSYTFLRNSNTLQSYWRPCKSENEPWFDQGNFHPDNSYTIINDDVINISGMKYAERCISDLDPYTCAVVREHYIKYLCEFARHPNIEYLMKSGFGFLIAEQMENGNRYGIRINWKSNDVKKMLKLNKEEMSFLNYSSCELMSTYLWFRNELNNMYESFNAAKRYKDAIDTIKKIKSACNLSARKIVNYANNHSGEILFSEFVRDWNDYLNECKKLGYDLNDSLINRPKDMYKAHERTTKLIKYKEDEIAKKQMEERNKKLNDMKYIDKKRGLIIVIPKTPQDIINEGKVLNHCVGGYAQRHVKGTLTILFLRKIDKPDVPYYTMEVSQFGQIVQCRGFKNNNAGNPKPQEIREFEAEYQQYLNVIFNKMKGRKIA